MRALRTAIGLAIALGLAAGLAAAGDDAPYKPEFEQRIGREAAAQVERQYKRYENEEALAKLKAIVDEIAKASSRPGIDYDVRALDTDEVNAFSLPGGIIYATRGLLEDAQSDHELAGVLAHEIAHNCTYDALIQADRNKDLFTGSVAAAIAAILLGGSSDTISTVLVAGEYVRQGVLGGYSVEMESAADAHAVEYMLKTSYNPMGLVTFMGRLAAKWRGDAEAVDPGVFRTHPDPTDRVADLKELLSSAGVDMNPRATTKWERPTVEQVEVEGAPVTQVVLQGQVIFRVLVAGTSESVEARAGEIVQRLTDAMAAGLQRYEVRVGDEGGNPTLEARGATILTVYPEDAQAQDAEPLGLARRAQEALKLALRTEELNRYW